MCGCSELVQLPQVYQMLLCGTHWGVHTLTKTSLLGVTKLTAIPRLMWQAMTVHQLDVCIGQPKAFPPARVFVVSTCLWPLWRLVSPWTRWGHKLKACAVPSLPPAGFEHIKSWLFVHKRAHASAWTVTKSTLGVHLPSPEVWEQPLVPHAAIPSSTEP